MRDSLKKYTEAELVAGCVRGDREAQRQLYERYSSSMYPVCVRFLGREDAKDMLQEGFLTVFDKIGSYKGEGSLEGWMRKVFVNASLMQIRKVDVLRRAEELDAPQGGGIDVMADYGVLEHIGSKEILDLVADLPAGLRSVFNLFVIEGYTHAEVGKSLGITEQSSRSQLSRARAILQEKIKKMYNGKK